MMPTPSHLALKSFWERATATPTTTLWHLLTITLWGLPLISPLLRWTTVACTHDGHLHHHRIAAMRYAWQNGLYFSRWLPDLAFGYGYPFFIYREPVPLYAGLFPHLLGLPLSASTNLVYALAILASGWFMYLWVRDVLGAQAGLVSAVAYMAAPYVLVDTLIRGNSPEAVALPLFPFLLWIGRRWLLTGSLYSFLTAVFALALLSLSHNISLLLFTPTLLIYLLTLNWLHKQPWRPAFLRLVLLFGLGLGITSFYTGGALLELNEVTLNQSTNTRNNDFRFNFATLDEIFAPVAPENPALLNPPLPFRLGWAPSLLALLGLIIGVRHPHRQKRGHVLLMAGSTAVFLFMSLASSRFLWETIPLIDFVQFPWRFVGRAALPIAFLAGVPFANFRFTPTPSQRIDHLRWRRLLPFTLYILPFILLSLEAIPLLYPTICHETAYPTINDVHAYERQTGLVGVDPEGSYFPQTVRRRPRSSPMEANYQAGQTPQRFDTTQLPADATLTNVIYGPNSATLQLTTPQPFTAHYHTFAFPGWQVHINDNIVPITASDPEGYITFAVPTGSHTIDIRWVSTPTRTLLTTMSLLALLLTGITALLIIRTQSRPLPHPLPQTSPMPLISLISIALLLITFKFFVIDKSETPWRRVIEPPVANTAVLQAAELQLMGYTLSQTSVASGSSFDIDLAWLTRNVPTADYQSNVWLVDEQGVIWSDKETHRPRLYESVPPSRAWRPGQWVWDSREIPVFAGTPAGRYNIVLTLFDLATLQPITLNQAGMPLGPTTIIGQIDVTPAPRPVSVSPQYPLTHTMVNNLTLLGYNQDRTEAIPGEQLLLTLFWQKEPRPSQNDTLTLTLQDDNGRSQQTWHLPIGSPHYKPTQWQTGERIRDQHPLRLPAHLESATYTFQLNDTITLGTIAVNAPNRTFEQPPVETVVNTPFLNAQSTPIATLIGINQPSSSENQTSKITLLWQATTSPTTSYRVFVHLIDESGTIIAQADGEPANWSRPTTGWTVGEYISDTHTLTLPEALPDEALSWRIGLYDPTTGQRLRTPTADFVTQPR